MLLRTGRSFAEESDKVLAEEIIHPNFKNKTEAIRIVKGLSRILAGANRLIVGDLSWRSGTGSVVVVRSRKSRRERVS